MRVTFRCGSNRCRRLFTKGIVGKVEFEIRNLFVELLGFAVFPQMIAAEILQKVVVRGLTNKLERARLTSSDRPGM